MNLRELIYYSSSPWVQNSLVSLAGRIQFSKRYQHLRSHLIEISRIEAFNEREKTDYQSEKIEKMIRFCGTSIPFYQKIFADHGINYTQISSKRDLQKVPVLTKRTVIDNIDSLIYPYAKRYITQKTSGTTGTPFIIHMDKRTYQLAMALLVAHEINHGVSFGARRATFAGRLVKSYSDNNPPFFRLNKPENQAIFSTYHLSSKTLKHYDSELSDFQPEEIIGYPSAIYNLAILYLKKNKAPSFVPKTIITNSETLFSWQRKVIERVFGCTIYDYYGTAEYILFAGQARDLSYSVNPILGAHEIIDDQGLQSTSGRIIGTSLTNTIMPLLRYEIGDTAELLSEFSVRAFTGRVDDQIHTPDGRKIGRTGEIFGSFTNIREAQIIQKKINQCEVRIVKAEPLNSFPENKLLDLLSKKFGPDITFNITYVDSIERGNNGKFKAVKSYVV